MNNSTNNNSDFGKKSVSHHNKQPPSLFELREIVSRYIHNKDQLLHALELFFEKMNSDHEKQKQHLEIQNQVLKELIIELKMWQDYSTSSKPSMDEEELAVLELSKLNQTGQQSRSIVSQGDNQQTTNTNRARRTRKKHNFETSKQTTDTDSDDDLSEEQCLFEPKEPLSTLPNNYASLSKQAQCQMEDEEKTEEETDYEIEDNSCAQNTPLASNEVRTRPLQNNHAITTKDQKTMAISTNKPVTFINHGEASRSKRGRKRKVKSEVEDANKAMNSIVTSENASASNNASSGIIFFQSDYAPVSTTSSTNNNQISLQKIPKKRGPKPGSKRGSKASFTIYDNDSFKPIYDCNNSSMNGKQPNSSFFSDSKLLGKNTTSVPDPLSTSPHSTTTTTQQIGSSTTNSSATTSIASNSSSEVSSLSISKTYSASSRFVKSFSPQRHSPSSSFSPSTSPQSGPLLVYATSNNSCQQPSPQSSIPIHISTNSESVVETCSSTLITPSSEAATATQRIRLMSSANELAVAQQHE
ncbi:hypothetical protein FDP41_010341 [Naegleria fowleri]|uniref:Polycomb group protein RNA binding region domain-containing protein n=1 Tax=Naegleria fowleri TaxID=5763 RepID=A0A6A5C6A0_NAEFO|nr:uncharacterized protein FDP41_010341 [Naegleria fowleri]KAF0983276.1 hypothetical protein FDP41_010341 [Naegleria fowleri]